MRRFLGVCNWVRLHSLAEYALAAAAVTSQLKKGATWPGPPSFEKGVEAP